MGQSTDAYLFYGICFDVDDEGDIYKPDGHAEDELDEGDGADDEDRESWEGRYRRLLGENHSNSTCTIEVHCCHDCPMPLVAVRGTMRIATRGYPEKIQGLEFDERWPAMIEEFCRKMQIVAKPDGPPGWRLASWWG